MAEMRVLTEHVLAPEQYKLKTYLQNGGYSALKKIIPQVSPQELLEMVIASELRGRGGAGFPAGKKWNFLPKDEGLTRYLVCNSDESEPGTFKDRLIIENDPHQLIEGIILSCYAVKVHAAFIYCRGEFYEGMSKLNQAIQEATEAGFLGNRILGSDFSLSITVHPGAGAYIAGEETALLNSLEGYRATPRLKPPFPAISGLYGKPTIINNVETLCNVVHIAKNGVEWYRNIGKPQNRGTKIFQLSGHIQRPGCYEFPLGVTLQEVLECAGGMFPGRTFKACYPGGSSCALLTARDLNISLDFESLSARGSALGTASMIVMDDSADMVKVAKRLMEFYQNESCGKCTPCREGTRWVVQLLNRVEQGQGTYRDLKTMEEICTNMAATSFCPLAVGAAPPVVSALQEFNEEFVAYIRKNPDADKNPKMRVAYPYL